jgi:hypothetical protein
VVTLLAPDPSSCLRDQPSTTTPMYGPASADQRACGQNGTGVGQCAWVFAGTWAVEQPWCRTLVATYITTPMSVDVVIGDTAPSPSWPRSTLLQELRLVESRMVV